MDILIALVENAGEVIDSKELVARAWPKTFVDDINNLRVHITAIRKVLGDGRNGVRYIANVVGRGYSFVAPVSISFESASAKSEAVSTTRVHNLPAPISRIVGRTESIGEIADMVMQHDFVTVTGAGGIGKTTVSIAVAESIASANDLEACFVDLAKLSDPHLVPDTLASALGLSLVSKDAMPSVVKLLERKRILIVLDNCEHVIGTAARISEVLIGIGPNVKVLATSREPLRVQREWVYRLPPLANPPVFPGARELDAAYASGFSAIELFAERASASMDNFELSDSNAGYIAAFCRKLDGIPLAIELAASQLQFHGIEGLSNHLEDFLRVMSIGRRTANTRHRTLRALLDWSFSTLSEKQTTVIRRLAILRGLFDMRSATAIAVSPLITSEDVCDAVICLAEKSLISVDVSGENASYRLLETTRTYAADLLRESGELSGVARRHAVYCLHFFVGVSTDWESRPAIGSVAAYRDLIDDVRSAIDWTFSPDGDAGLGVKLTAASAPLWFHLSIIQEYNIRLEFALLNIASEQIQDAQSEMQLNAALGHALFHTVGPVSRMAEALDRTLALSDELDIHDHKARAYWGLCSYMANVGDYVSRYEYATRFYSFSATLPSLPWQCLGVRMMGLASHAVGEEAVAQSHLEFILAQPVEAVRRDATSAYDFDARASSKALLGVILWIRGFPEQASRMADEAIHDAVATSHTVSLCYALAANATPVSLWSGDTTKARGYIDLLLEESRLYSLTYWKSWADSLDSVCTARAHGRVGALGADIVPFRTPAFGAHLDILATVGYVAPGFLDRPDSNLPSWCHSEIVRLQADRAALSVGSDAILRAEVLYRRSIAFAHERGALSWELRAATGLAQLLRDHDRRKEGYDTLAAVHGRFKEGFATSDVRSAARLLNELQR
jgi:predicted ATPase